MTPVPERIVDAHVHLWDPAQTDWYPYLSGGRELDLGDTSGMARRFDVPTYLAESARWNVVKLVNVAAATGNHSTAETLELDRGAERDGHPDAIIGGVVPSAGVAEGIAQIDAQMQAPRFRGVRPMGAGPDTLPAPEILTALRDRGLVFDLLARPDQLEDAARGLEMVDDLIVVVEHLGWPRSGSPEEWATWTSGLDALASLGDNVVCKLSGLAMPLATMDADTVRPWIEHAIETFGVDRCMFASNFPVDGMHGTFDDLYESFCEITAPLDDDSRDRLFATNAERIYSC